MTRRRASTQPNMKSVLSFLCLALALGFVLGGAGGCAGISLDRLRLRQYAQEFQYTQDADTAMKAAQAALEDMGFEREFGSGDSDRIEMISRTLPGGAAQARQQRRAIVTVGWTSEGMSQVRIGFWNESEDPSASESVPASGRLIKEGALYDAFWQRMDRALPAGSSVLPEEPIEAPGKN